MKRTNNYLKVYNILKKNNFPYCPDDFDIARKELSKDTTHIYINGNNCVMIFCELNNEVYIDVCIPKEHRLKWINKETINFIGNMRNKFNVDYFLAEANTKESYDLLNKRFNSIHYNFFKI